MAIDASGRRRRWTHDGAVAVMRAANLEPLEEFAASHKPWRCRCLVCGAVGTPRLGGILAGQGGCTPCGQEKVARKTRARRHSHGHAAAVMRAAGLEPLVPYGGAMVAWRCRCMICGNEVSPTFAHVQARGRGCRFCATHGVDLATPAMVYVISHASWNAVKIGIGACVGYNSRLVQHQRQVWVLVQAGEYLTGAAAWDVEQAVLARLRKAGLCPYLSAAVMPNGFSETCDAARISASELWSMVEEESVRADRGYLPTVGQRPRSATALLDPEKAAAELRAAGFEPLEVYPGYVNTPWRAKCLSCGYEARKRLNGIRRGGGCRRCVDRAARDRDITGNVEKATAAMRGAGFEPLEPYSGSDRPWRCRCLTCGEVSSPRYGNVSQGRSSCRYCAGQVTTAPTRRRRSPPVPRGWPDSAGAADTSSGRGGRGERRHGPAGGHGDPLRRAGGATGRFGMVITLDPGGGADPALQDAQLAHALLGAVEAHATRAEQAYRDTGAGPSDLV